MAAEAVGGAVARFGQTLCGGAVVPCQHVQFELELAQAHLRIVEQGQFRFGAQQLRRKFHDV